ncbi:MAG TPA: xanthine dehydrogenase family protein molybdopterin-binding subunit [Burkholderiales bacterium]
MHGAIGKPLQRKEDLRLLTGQGRFTDDLGLEGQAHAAMVRSPHAHARIRKIDAQKASKAPGVLATFTGADCAAAGLRAIGHSPMPSTRFDMKLVPPEGKKLFYGRHALLPTDKARYAGEAVAMVVARTRDAALDAADLVEVDYEPLPAVTHSEAALAPRAAAVWEEAPGNLLVDTRFGDAQATDAAFARAAHVVKMDFHVPRVTACALEPRSALGVHDAASGRYTLWAPTGGAVRQKRELAAVLGIDEAQLRVVTQDVGGNFGSRNRVYVEYGLVLWAARKLGCPVKFSAARAESFVSDYQGRDLVMKLELALDAEGKFLALRSDNLSNVGAYCVSLSPLSKGSGLVTGSYCIPAATLRSRAVFTHTPPTNPYRSSGRPEVTFAIERLVDTAARELGLDRVELRRRNLVPAHAMPYRNAVGMTYDSGTYEANMDLALRLADWEGFRNRRAQARKRGRILGIGLANYVESSIGSPRERAEMTVLPQGRVRVVIGTQPSGQGHETSFAQVVAQLLSVPVETVDIVLGDTDVVSVGGGSHSGRSMRHAAAVFSLASQKLLEKAQRIADFLGETQGVRFDLFELSRKIENAILPPALQGGLAVAADNEMHDPVFPNGCAICECEVDPETGAVSLTRYAAVDDVGRCVNPLIVHGQTHGGIAQGVGQAMSELCYFDAEGQPLAASLMDYGLPRGADLPAFRAEIVEVLSPTNAFGIKAGGEGGTTPAPAAVINAIVDALAEFGVRDVKMPATPYNLWRILNGR